VMLSLKMAQIIRKTRRTSRSNGFGDTEGRDGL